MTTEILKFCNKHGALLKDQVRWEKNKKYGKQLRCIQCKIEKDARYYQNHSEKLINKNKDYKKKNRNKVNEWNRQDRLKNPEKHKEWARIGRERLGVIRSIKEVTRLRGITLEQYYQLVGSQDNKCAICEEKETRKNRMGDIARLCIDHNHETNEVRQLLCHACNQVVGHSRESIEILQNTIEYLKKHAE